MNPEILSAAIAGVVSLLVSSLIAAWMQRKKLISDYDIALRSERLKEYRKLWELTELLGWYGNHAVTPEIATKLLSDFDHWYFKNGGGLLLSDLSVFEFEALLLALKKYDGDSNKIRTQATRLRAALAYDIGGRNLPLLRRRPRAHELERNARIRIAGQGIKQSESAANSPRADE